MTTSVHSPIFMPLSFMRSAQVLVFPYYRVSKEKCDVPMGPFIQGFTHPVFSSVCNEVSEKKCSYDIVCKNKKNKKYSQLRDLFASKIYKHYRGQWTVGGGEGLGDQGPTQPLLGDT